MKIAISSTGKNLNDDVAEVFGRCSYFIIVEVENQKLGKPEILENKNMDQVSGAGVSVAQVVAEKNIDVVITRNIGPRALDVLRQFNIKIYSGDGVIKDALQKFIDEKLKEI
ncbi:MAG: NifB/NifX family molybdenum-iron cluster-binding protein [Patescibacteria group bacterium]|nr:NifB/NifX family molybdenum-iron cluster-binding protein [Patescibacteria group bacterium]